MQYKHNILPALKPLIIILGQTASGKSELALKLAKKYSGEIINADSRQIYKDMGIGTASPFVKKTRCKMRTFDSKHKKCGNKYFILDSTPHYLFHFVNPNDVYSVAEYKKNAIETIHDIHRRNKLPILVGGTGLYISSVVDNLEIPEAPPNDMIRKKLEKKSIKSLFNLLKKIDPTSAAIIGPDNKRKIVRSIEVYRITGKPFSSQQNKGEPIFDILEIGIMVNREKLYEKIDRRVDEMIKSGLIDETKKLLKKYRADLPAMSGIGYKEIKEYLSGKLSLEDATQRIKFRTHQYARRQMTWFKRDTRIKWVSNLAEAQPHINRFLNKRTE